MDLRSPSLANLHGSPFFCLPYCVMYDNMSYFNRALILTTKGDRQMNTANNKKMTRYEIREFKGDDYSKSMSQKLRERNSAQKLVKRLKKMGHNAFISPIKIYA